MESKIKVTDPFYKPQLTCPEDSFFMEHCFACGHRGTELAHLSSCHAHLHALRLSDSCMADGRHLTDDSMEVQLDPRCSLPLSWPCTHHPKFQIRLLWRSALCKVFSQSMVPQVLVKPLSPFLPSTCSPSEQRLFAPTALFGTSTMSLPAAHNL